MRRILLFGGGSEERLVSVASAQNVLRNALFQQVYFVDPKLQVFQEVPEKILKHERVFEQQYTPQGPCVSPSLWDQNWWVQQKPAVVFIAMHGGEAENGKLQAFFEQLGIAFTGSDSRSSYLAFHKDEAKKRVQAAGGRVARGQQLPLENPKACLHQYLQEWGGLVVKPVASGSSFALFFISSMAEIENFLQQWPSLSSHRFLVEEWVKGREFTVGVVQRPSLNDLPLLPSEVILERGRFFDYQGKYLGQGVQEITPALLRPEEQQKAQDLALLAHRSLHCYGYSRTDMILTEHGDWVFLETNTLPGLSVASFIPQQLVASGLSVAQFVDEQIALALQRVT